MVRTSRSTFLALAATFVLSGTVSAFALGKDVQVQAGVADYAARDYADAVLKLKKADQNNSRVRYYLALSYQALGDFKDAESHYLWVYRHGTDKDLKYKSWQGVQGLSTMRRNRQPMVAGSVPHAAAGSSVAPAVDSPKDMHTALDQFTKTHNVKFNVTYTPGCPRHSN